MEEDITRYEHLYKPNDIKNHSLFHINVSTLNEPYFSFNENKEKFKLDGIIVCYLKVQGYIKIDKKTLDEVFMTLTDDDGSICKIHYIFSPGHEIALQDFEPIQGELYEVLCKPDPRDKNALLEKTLYAFSIQKVSSPEHHKFFLTRCLVEKNYISTQSIQNRQNIAKPYSKPATVEEVNAKIISTTSKHLVNTTINGKRKYAVSCSRPQPRRNINSFASKFKKRKN